MRELATKFVGSFTSDLKWCDPQSLDNTHVVVYVSDVWKRIGTLTDRQRTRMIMKYGADTLGVITACFKKARDHSLVAVAVYRDNREVLK